MLTETLSRDPAILQASLPALPPLEQEVLMRDLLQQLPAGGLETFCRGLAASPAARSCARAMERPHLQSPPPPPHALRMERAGPGPASDLLPPPPVRPPDWQQVSTATLQGALSGCEGLPSCIREQAQAAAGQGDVLLAGAICQQSALPRPSLTQECFFSAAEALATRYRSARWADSLSLCAAAESYVFGCLDHIFSLSLPDIPPADQPDAASLAAARIAVVDMSGLSMPDFLQALYRDRFWAQWTYHAYHRADRVTGHLLAHLPAEARPHIHAAAAARLLERAPGTASTSLSALAEALDAALLIDGPLAETLSASDYTPFLYKPASLWLLEAPLEDQVPVAYYIGQARRPVAPGDDATDRRLALLEAAARQSPPLPASFFLDVVHDEAAAEVVRWSALRLAGSLYPEAARATAAVGAMTPLLASRQRLLQGAP